MKLELQSTIAKAETELMIKRENGSFLLPAIKSLSVLVCWNNYYVSIIAQNPSIDLEIKRNFSFYENITYDAFFVKINRSYESIKTEVKKLAESLK